MITSVMLVRQVPLSVPRPTNLTPLFRYPCSLFALFFQPLPFVFNSLQPLFPKHPGWGPTSTRTVSLSHSQCVLPVSIFKMNTCESVSKQTTSSPFRMNTYAKPGGGGPLTSAPPVVKPPQDQKAPS